METAGETSGSMKPSAFNLRVPMPTGDVFLMNTLTDAQVVVSSDVVALLDRLDAGTPPEPDGAADERAVLETLATHGFVVRNRAAERAALESYFGEFHDDASQLRITILTTLQCNFACDYCYQGEDVPGNGVAGRRLDRPAD
jgi:uncharacterized protein